MADHREIFPPFVLTQTTDIRFKQLVQGAKRSGLSSTQFYQQLVGHEYETALATLEFMGRPGWDRTKLGDLTNKEDPIEVIQLAADMLLGGWSAPRRESYRQESLFGVASMICRLGLSPSSWSPLASHTVAACMATLVYVTASHDQLVAAYTSDPVLTFGAACVWYQTDSWDDVQWTLATHILPQFRKVLQQDMVDTSGRRHDFISRILLLLAMDATGLVVESAPSGYCSAPVNLEREIDSVIGLLLVSPYSLTHTVFSCSRTRSWNSCSVGSGRGCGAFDMSSRMCRVLVVRCAHSRHVSRSQSR
jgi:hypothetical protein